MSSTSSAIRQRRVARRWRLRAVAVLALALASGGCSNDAPTTVLLRLTAQPGLPTPEALLLFVFDASGRAVDARRLPEQGLPQLPGDVVLYPSQASGTLRLLVQARLGKSVVGEGATTVALRSGAQVAADLLIATGRLPDRDGDGVPDLVDNCPDQPNPEQTPCGGPDAGPDASDGPSGDGRVDLPSDLPAPDLPVECKNAAQCDDGNPCTDDRCVGGRCVRLPGAEGDACDDGDACTSGTTCEAGVCRGGAPITCPAAPTCKTSSCDPQQGCLETNAPNGDACDDGVYCSVQTTCTDGVCGGGSARDCGTPTACHALTCNEKSGGCVTSTLAANTPCDDGDSCTQDERCNSWGSCIAPGEVNELIVSGTAANGRTDRSTLVDAAGVVHAVFHVDTVGVVYATNASGAWTLKPLDSAAGAFNDAALVADTQGLLTVFYVHETSGELRTVHRTATGSWSAPEKVANAQLGTGLLIDPTGTFHLTYTYGRALRYVSGTAGSWSAPVVVDPIPSGVTATVINGHGPSMARNAAGHLHVAYSLADIPIATPIPIELRYATNASGSWVASSPAKAQLPGSHGGNPSLAIGKNGTIYITHAGNAFYLTQGGLNPSWNTQTLQTGTAGVFSSLVLDGSDHLHIASTLASGATELDYTTNASGAFVTSALESGNNTGRWVSLARAPSGRLHMVFSRQASQQLRHYTLSACP